MAVAASLAVSGARRMLAAAGLALCSTQTSGAPGPADYAMQLGSSIQHQSNPGRLSDANSKDIRGSTVRVNSLGLGLRLPLLSEETRLEAGGTLADARYSDNHNLDHRPSTLNAALPWRAGSLLSGRFQYGHQRGLHTNQGRSWPEPDIRTRETRGAELGLRVTDSLTLPVLGVFQNETHHDQEVNRTLYDRKDEGWQLSARYAGFGRSYAQVGLRQTDVDYFERPADLVSTIDNRYTDNETFVAARWDYSPKTLLQGRLGMLQRNYQHLDDRDTRLVTFEGRATWDYSPKTQFDLQLWRRPYAYDDDPSVLYAVITGGQAAVTWRPTVKTAFQLGVEYGRQRNTAYNGGSDQVLHIQRVGARVQWQADDNLRWVADVYRDRQQGNTQQDSYSQNFVRIGLEYTFGRGAKPALQRMMQPTDCQWRRPELALCDPMGGDR